LTSSYQKSLWQMALSCWTFSVIFDQMLGLLPHDVIPNWLFLAQFLCWLTANMQDKLAAQDLLTSDDIAAAVNRIFNAWSREAALQQFWLMQLAATPPLPSHGGHCCSPSCHGRRSKTPADSNGDGYNSEGREGLCSYQANFGQ
jgi:hypothetical protein